MADMLTNRELDTIEAVGDHLTVIHMGTPGERRQILGVADETLTRALCALAKVAHESGGLDESVYQKHAAKLKRALGERIALSTKMKLAQSQRGGAFWKSIVKAALPVIGGAAGSLLPVPGVGTALGGLAGRAIAGQI